MQLTRFNLPRIRKVMVAYRRNNLPLRRVRHSEAKRDDQTKPELFHGRV